MSHAFSIELEGLRKSFRRVVRRGAGVSNRLADFVSPRTEAVQAIEDVSFRIAPGERVAFIGPNGAGKAATLKVLAGMLLPDGGDARVLGVVPGGVRRRLAFAIGTVFGQRSQLWYQLPARDSFRLFGAVYELPARELERRLSELVEAFELGGFLDTPVHKLSLGQR